MSHAKFQSTPPRGGRRERFAAILAAPCFNPRPRAGGDRACSRSGQGQVFQSTPPRGGRPARLLSERPRAGVSIHAPARGATEEHRRTVKAGCAVSIHAPARGATPCSARTAPAARFQSTPPRGGRPVPQCGTRRGARFQSTPPRGGRPADVLVEAQDLLGFQSTPPRGGRRSVHRAPRPMVVSIHAPARGATWRRWTGYCSSASFNPRPRAGGDCLRARGDRRPSFNPRPRAGGDLVQAGHRRTLSVSIHAPARGATPSSLRVESTVGMFQSTPPRGGRRGSPPGPRRCSCFNPRPRAGGDATQFLNLSRLTGVSIHAPARGATSGLPGACGPASVSIHAPARGATDLSQHGDRRDLGFNPRPRAGGDDDWASAGEGGTAFQSTPPRGGRLGQQIRIIDLFAVSIHAPARGATRWGWRAARRGRVSIHAPARGATALGQPRRARGAPGFNPRPRAGGDKSSTPCLTSHPKFQSTPPRGGRPRGRCPLASRFPFQSTPPRGGRRPATTCRPNRQVSIHAPARGATDGVEVGAYAAPGVSIHAPARGATRSTSASARGGRFQSTPPRGGRLARREARQAREAVSIHAPARGATPTPRACASRSSRFQSTPPRGGRRGDSPNLSRWKVSIHAPARGATAEGLSPCRSSIYDSVSAHLLSLEPFRQLYDRT